MADVRTSDSVLGLFLRLYWMVVGNGVLVIAAAYPLSHSQTTISQSVAACSLVAISLIAARYLDIRACGGQTVDGDPADLGHWKRYVLITIPVSLLLPVGAQALKALM